ncbi:hypothetical protein HDU82_004224 [Entophlyctis luteolus]|nr:hypothetical protein HDU82_004224 [Entophlyctis luteolus]
MLKFCNNHMTELFTLPTTLATIAPTAYSAFETPQTTINVSGYNGGQNTIPENKTLIQSDSFSLTGKPICWEVGETGGIIGAPCNPSNPLQWWSRSFAQLVYTDQAGATHCAGVSNSLIGTQVQVRWCGSDATQSFLFGPDGTLRFANSYLCAGLNSTAASNPNIIVEQDIRKEWRDLGTLERSAYIAAVQGLRSMPSTAGRHSFYDDIVAVHASVIDYIHQNPVFWPWHRNFMRLYEEALQQVDPSVTLPYWDWGFDGDAPLSNTDIFGPNNLQFGTRGSSTSPYPACLKDGFAKTWKSDFNQCTSRNYTLDVLIYDNDALLPIILSSNDFAVFAKAMEAAHNVVHYYIGGITGDLYYIDLSTNDPLFFLHHANVDRYWHLWQYHNPNVAAKYDGTADFPPGSTNQVNVQLADIMPGVNMPVSFAMRADSGNGFCVKYIPYSKSPLSISISDQSPISRRETHKRSNREKRSLVREVERISVDWPVFSELKKGFDFDDEAMARMHKSMLIRLREGEGHLLNSSRLFHKAIADHLAGPGNENHTLIQAKLAIVQTLKRAQLSFG